jgi:hypothetical protein
MASLVYNRGKRLIQGRACGRTSLPTKFKLALLKSTYTPNADHATFADVSAHEITGSGYNPGGIDIEASSVGFTADAQDDTGDTGDVTMKDAVFQATGGGQIPTTGGARYAVRMDYNATQANGQLIEVFDLLADKQTGTDSTLTLSGFKSRGT